MTIRDVEELADMLSSFTPDERRRIVAKNRELEKRQVAERRLYSLFPEAGPLRRELYPKHLSFFAAGGAHETMVNCPSDCNGSPHNERAFIAGNRVGKTMAICYELVCHLIGWYPPWWKGRRFDRPIVAWVAGEDAKSVRESIQVTLLGAKELKSSAIGTGLIPRENIVDINPRQGVSDAVDTMIVRTAWGGTSALTEKTYDQGREAYQGAAIDVVVFDEEPPDSIYSEGHTRVLSTTPGQPNGIVLCSFTPLKGLTSVVLSYLPNFRPTVPQ